MTSNLEIAKTFVGNHIIGILDYSIAGRCKNVFLCRRVAGKGRYVYARLIGDHRQYKIRTFKYRLATKEEIAAAVLEVIHRSHRPLPEHRNYLSNPNFTTFTAYDLSENNRVKKTGAGVKLDSLNFGILEKAVYLPDPGLKSWADKLKYHQVREPIKLTK